MSNTERKITTGYLNHFLSSIKKGYPVLYVQESGILAVDHPADGYLVLQLKDKVVDSKEESSITNGS